MRNFLTFLERNELMKRHRAERDKRICDRIKAVLAYDDGYSYSEIARLLLLDDETIRRHIQDYQALKKLETNNGGSQSKLTGEESQELIAHLGEITYLYVKDICAYVKTRYGKIYSVSGMRKWLHVNGFRYKKPHAVPAKADKARQEEFINYYEKLKRKAGEKEPIYFVDSVHPQHQTQLVYGWIPKGERKALPMTGRQKRLNFIGGICLEGHRFSYHQADRVDGEEISLFLGMLRKQNPGDGFIHVIWDNAGYHRDRKIRELAKQLKIKIHYLPPYSPNLNPIERLWKVMREQVMYNRYYESFADFSKATLDFFKTIGRKKNLLRRRITDNFQILHSPLFAS